VAAVTLPIGQFTVGAGHTVLGPFLTGAGLTHAKLTFDVLALLGTLAVAVDYAADGLAFVNLCAVSGAGPIVAGTGPKGNSLSDWQLETDLHSPSTNLSQVRVTTDCSLAFVSAGGSLAVS
jgi:hypothetical protein